MSVESTNWSFNTEKKTSEIKQVPLGELKCGQIRVKISTFGVITTDLFAKQHSAEVLLGSQAFGHVTAVAADEGRFKVGDRVAIGMYKFACGSCRECHKGNNHLCRKSEFTSGATTGGYGTYLDICSESAFPVPASIPDEEAPVLVSDGSAIYSALKRHVKCTKGSLAIAGSKAVGQLALGYARALGYTDVTVVGELDDKAAIEAQGAKFQDCTTNKCKFDTVLLCITSIDSDCYNKAISATRMGGKLIVVGHPAQHNILIPFFDLVAGELSLIQNLVGNQTETYEALYLAAKHHIHPRVSLHKFEEVPKLFEELGKAPYCAYQIVKN